MAKNKAPKNKRILPSGKIQVVRTYTFDNGKKQRIYGTGDTEEAAISAMNGKIKDIQDRITFGDAIDAGEITIKQAIELFLYKEEHEVGENKGRPLRSSTVMRDHHVCKSLLFPFEELVSTKVKELAPIQCIRWKDAVVKMKSSYGRPFGTDYKNRAIFLLHASIDPYYTNTLQESPVKVIVPWKKIHKKKTEKDILLPEEIYVFLNYCSEHFDDYRAQAAWLQLQIFIRPGEILALKVKDYNPIQRILHIQRTLIKKTEYDEKKKKNVEREYISKDGEVKTEESDRLIPLSESICDFLNSAIKNKGQEDLMFPCRTGGAGNEGTYNKWFKKTLKACGINKNLHVHNLRTSGISLAAYAGADVDGISKIAGHSSIAVTQEFYTAVYERKKKEAADKVADAFSALLNK